MRRTTRDALDRRRAEALALRIGGASFRQIGQRLLVSHETARADVALAMVAAREDWTVRSQRTKIIIDERLRVLLSTYWRASIGCGCDGPCDPDECPNPTEPDPAAADVVLRILELQAAIHGLVPNKVDDEHQD